MKRRKRGRKEEEKAEVIPLDLVEVRLKWEHSFTDVSLKLFMLDIQRIANICKKAENTYYYSELRWFIEQVAKNHPDIGYVDFNRKLPRMRLKEKKKWELEQISRKVS